MAAPTIAHLPRANMTWCYLKARQMAKQTLYEILGIAPTASTEEILSAYQARKQALQLLQGEERNNHLAFLEYAREHLADPQKRVRYERTLREADAATVIESEHAPAATRGGATSSALLRLVLLVVLASAASYAWQRYRSRPAPAVEPPKHALAAPIQTPENNEVGEGLVFEPAARTTADRAASTAPMAGTSAASTSQKAYHAHSTAVDAELVKKLVLSVYAVVGTRGFGTGVVVDNDRLLTNCHVIAGNAQAGKMYAVNTITQDKAEITEVAYLDHQDACLIRAPGISGQAVPINNFSNLSTSDKTHNIGFARGTLISSEGNFQGWAYRFGQKFLVSSNFCDHGVSGGPLVDDEGRLLGLTTGGPADRSYCLSVTADTISALKFETSRPLAEFPANYTSNVSRRN